MSGKTEQIFRDPQTKKAARLTGCKNFSRAVRIDAHTLRAADWGITLHISREIPEDTAYIGYRAHDFIPVWGERGRNMIRFSLESSAALPFEKNYYIKPENGEELENAEPVRAAGDGDSPAEEVICWFVQREKLSLLDEKGLPDYLAFDEDAILFLR